MDDADGADSGVDGLPAIGREPGEIMPAGKDRGAGAQLLAIKQDGDMPGTPDLERGENRPVRNPVAINFSEGAESSMKGCRNERTTENPNCRWQRSIQRCAQCHRRQSRLEIGMRALAEGMHAGIGSTGAMKADCRPGDFCERAFDVVLDGIAINLALPAGEGAAVIGDDEFCATDGVYVAPLPFVRHRTPARRRSA